MSEQEFGRDATSEEANLLHTAGFHEVKGLDGVWQRGRVRSNLARKHPPKMYTTDEALQLVRKERK